MSDGTPDTPDTIPDEFDMMAFKLAWAQIIAKAWEEPAFEQELYGMSPEEVRSTFQIRFGVVVPQDLDIKIYEMDSKKDHWDKTDKKWQLVTKTAVRLGLPPRPEDQDQFALAIAAYSSLSRKFPLTCSC